MAEAPEKVFIGVSTWGNACWSHVSTTARVVSNATNADHYHLLPSSEQTVPPSVYVE
jgi:hypothetical protein